jgi:hypothetical protein
MSFPRPSRDCRATKVITFPFTNWDTTGDTVGWRQTTLLNAHGNSIEHYGDLDLEMSRKKLKQTGAIDQFTV